MSERRQIKCACCGGGTEFAAYKVKLPRITMHGKSMASVPVRQYTLCRDCLIKLAVQVEKIEMVKGMEDRRKEREYT